MSVGYPELAMRIAARRPAVTVVGDAVLDTWIHGTSERLAREAPAPVIDAHHEDPAPGGAANTAVNLAAMGAAVTLVTVLGDDAAGHRLRDLLVAAGVDVSRSVTAPGTTTTKSRVVVGDQVMYRLDRTADVLDTQLCGKFARAAAAAVEGADALVVCDYGGATSDPTVTQHLRDSLDSCLRPHPPLTVVDAHDPARWRVLSPDIITPNAAEAERLLGRTCGIGPSRVAFLTANGDDILAAGGARHAVVTLDRDGAVLVGDDRRSGPPERTWANPATEKQASGAGDTFVAALTLAVLADVEEEPGRIGPVALGFAQSAADIVVHRLGTSVCSTADLVEHLTPDSDVLTAFDDLGEELERRRALGQRVILTNGCFDVLHRGHTVFLDRARRLGDLLVVAVNDDDSVRQLKGPDRPVNSLRDRAAVLSGLTCVDYVTSFPGPTAAGIIEQVRPDVYVKGGNYSPATLEETPVVEHYGGQVRILEYVSDHSTSALLERLRRRRGASESAESKDTAGGNDSAGGDSGAA